MHPRTHLARTVVVAAALFTIAGCGLNSSPSQLDDAEADSPDAAAESEVEPGASDGLPEVEENPELAAAVPQEIRDAGVIRLATQAGYPPFGYMDEDGQTLIGLDIDLAQAIGDKLGLEIQPINTSFDAIIPSLGSDRADMAMASIGDTKEREREVDFATYYWNGTVVMVASGNPQDVDSALLCDVSIGVIRGSLQQSDFLPAHDEPCEAEGRTPPEASVFQDGPQAQLALSSGRVDGVMQDAPPLLDQVSKNPDAFEIAGDLVRNPNPGGVAFPKDSELVEPVNAALNELMADGTYQAVLEHWNLQDIGIDESVINGAVE